MKKLSKLTSILMAGAMLLSLAACGGNPTGGESGTSPSPAPSQSAAEPSNSAAPANTPDAAASYTVGICQLVQHEALDAATKGFIDAINEALPGQVTFDEQNASNDIPMCSTIINQFVA